MLNLDTWYRAGRVGSSISDCSVQSYNDNSCPAVAAFYTNAWLGMRKNKGKGIRLQEMGVSWHCVPRRGTVHRLVALRGRWQLRVLTLRRDAFVRRTQVTTAHAGASNLRSASAHAVGAGAPPIVRRLLGYERYRAAREQHTATRIEEGKLPYRRSGIHRHLRGSAP